MLPEFGPRASAISRVNQAGLRAGAAITSFRLRERNCIA
jgi:hypothetical protein